jgi:hypothetical protein
VGSYAANKMNIPPWLKQGDFACHTPTRTVFKPERKIGKYKGTYCLYDCNGQHYPYSECDRLDMVHLSRGLGLFVVEGGDALLIHPSPNPAHWFILTDGDRKLAIAPQPKPPQPSDGLKAAVALSQFFNGTLTTLEIDYEMPA